MRPVTMVPEWLMMSQSNNLDGCRVFRPHLRARVTCERRMAGAPCGVAGSRPGSHSLRIGGASPMFSAGYDFEIIKRWGRWPCSTIRRYICRDYCAMSAIGRWIPDAIQLGDSCTGRAGGGGEPNRCLAGKGENIADHQRRTDISHTMSRILRHKGMGGLQRDRFFRWEVS